MAPSEVLHCQACDEETEHRLVATTRLHLGMKRKWRCESCEHLHVTIDGVV